MPAFPLSRAPAFGESPGGVVAQGGGRGLAPAGGAAPAAGPAGGGRPPALSESMAALAGWSGGAGGPGGGGGFPEAVARGLGDGAARHAVMGVLQLTCASSCRVRGELLQAAATASPRGCCATGIGAGAGGEGGELAWGDARAAAAGLHRALRDLCFGPGTAEARSATALRLAIAADPDGGSGGLNALPREFGCLPQLEAASHEVERLWAGVGNLRSLELCAQLWDGLRWGAPGLLPHVSFALGAVIHIAAADASAAGAAVLRMLLEDFLHFCEASRDSPPQLLRAAAFVLAMDVGAALGPAARARAGPPAARALAGASAALRALPHPAGPAASAALAALAAPR